MNILNNLFGGGRNLAQVRNQQTQQSDTNQADQTIAQTQADTQKTQAQIHQIKQETQTKVSEMFRESNLNKAKSSSKIHGLWVKQMMA